MNVPIAFYLQSIRGPILLIILGVLVLFNQWSLLSFSQSWPILVISYGLLKLLERMLTKPAPYPPGGLQ